MVFRMATQLDFISDPPRVMINPLRNLLLQKFHRFTFITIGAANRLVTKQFTVTTYHLQWLVIR